MEYVNLGKTGLKISRICLGCMTYGAPATGELKGGRHAWALNEEESQPYLRQALDLGINFFDTANVYSTGASEEVLGNFLKTNVRREAVGRFVSPRAVFLQCLLDDVRRDIQTRRVRNCRLESASFIAVGRVTEYRGDQP